MHKKPVAAVINFCTNESRFLKACIEQARIFAQQIIIPVCDHFYDGKGEDLELLAQIYRSFPDCLFIQYPFLPEKVPRDVAGSSHFWHSFSRFLAVEYLQPEIDTILFIDADEVADGKKFAQWLDNSDYHQHTVLKLANYWYFREPRFQALKWEDSIVLAQRRALNAQLLLHEREREAIYDLLPGPKRRGVTSYEGEPMFHHFSWVRTKEEMLKKVRSWGHKKDRDWIAEVEGEFSAPFRGTDFVHGYQYKSIDPPFDVGLENPTFEPLLPLPSSLKKVSVPQTIKLLKGRSDSIWDQILRVFHR